jgi:hypothetical protein
MSSPVAGGVFRERCQFENTIYRYTPPLGELRVLRRGLRRMPDRFKPIRGEGKASQYAVGDLVRVRDEAAIRATLGPGNALRGLAFTEPQWAYCGKTFRVDAVVRRMMNDFGRMRKIARTVTLEGVSCDGPGRDAGCGRSCPLLFRDEWLEPSNEPAEQPAHTRFARVKPVEHILATLDRDGTYCGVLFSPAMKQYAGGRFPVHKRVEPIAATTWRRPNGEWYVLSGVRCLGEILNGDGPCHRGCGLLWHKDWLDFE